MAVSLQGRCCLIDFTGENFLDEFVQQDSAFATTLDLPHLADRRKVVRRRIFLRGQNDCRLFQFQHRLLGGFVPTWREPDDLFLPRDDLRCFGRKDLTGLAIWG